MSNPEYGSIEYYENMFSDILADLGTGNSAQDDIASINILIAFERAMQGWLDYHQQAATSYNKLLEIFRKNKTDVWTPPVFNHRWCPRV